MSTKIMKTPFAVCKYNALTEQHGTAPEVQARNGKAVRIICTDRKTAGPYVVLGLYKECGGSLELVLSYTVDGEYSEGEVGEEDLFILEKVQCWHGSDVPKGYYRPEPGGAYFLPYVFCGKADWAKHIYNCEDFAEGNRRLGLCYATGEEAMRAAKVIYDTKE